MAEVYEILQQCVALPPGVDPPKSIDMPVKKVNNPPTPVHRILAYPPARGRTSREYDTYDPDDRYADIYFSDDQFDTLTENLNARPMWVSYDALNGTTDDAISNQALLLHYP